MIDPDIAHDSMLNVGIDREIQELRQGRFFALLL